MRKIIYFDEGSATDILLIEHGGQISSINESEGTVSLKGKPMENFQLEQVLDF